MPIFNSRTAARLSALLASTALLSVPASAQEKVGTAAAVNPTTEGVSGGAARTLRLGSDVISNETIRTSASGSTQIMFVDKTTLSIGPSSSVKIDSYVFDPQANSGSAAITLGKGMMRFVGGEISHQSGVTLRTPVATVGVRGGTVTIAHTEDGTRIILHYGTAEVATPCGTVVIRQPGYAVSVAGAGECPSTPEKASKSEIDKALAFLSSGPGQTGGGTFTGTGPKTNNTYTGLPENLPLDLDDLVREAAEQFNVRDAGVCDDPYCSSGYPTH